MEYVMWIYITNEMILRFVRKWWICPNELQLELIKHGKMVTNAWFSAQPLFRQSYIDRMSKQRGWQAPRYGNWSGDVGSVESSSYIQTTNDCDPRGNHRVYPLKLVTGFRQWLIHHSYLEWSSCNSGPEFGWIWFLPEYMG